MAARNYSEAFKQKVLAHLRANGYSYYQTAKKFKVSKNTIKAWDDYPNNLPEEVKLKVKLNQLQRSKASLAAKQSVTTTETYPTDLPKNIKGLEHYAIKAALKKGIFLLDYVGSTKEYLEITKAITTIVQLPEKLKQAPQKSVLDLINEHLTNNNTIDT